jgi:hypothetical protein
MNAMMTSFSYLSPRLYMALALAEIFFCGDPGFFIYSRIFQNRREKNRLVPEAVMKKDKAHKECKSNDSKTQFFVQHLIGLAYELDNFL